MLAPWPSKPQYQVHSKEDSVHQESSACNRSHAAKPKPSRKPKTALWATFAITIALLISILIFTAKQYKTTSGPYSPSLLHCGTSPSEAESLGCKFDLMTFGWIPHACFNETMSLEWQAQWGPWTWLSNKTDPSSTIPLRDLPYREFAYGSQGYHEDHCLYSFKLVHMAGLEGKLLSSEKAGIEHTDHCIMVMTDSREQDWPVINTKVENLFTKCVDLRET